MTVGVLMLIIVVGVIAALVLSVWITDDVSTGLLLWGFLVGVLGILSVIASIVVINWEVPL